MEAVKTISLVLVIQILPQRPLSHLIPMVDVQLDLFTFVTNFVASLCQSATSSNGPKKL